MTHGATHILYGYSAMTTMEGRNTLQANAKKWRSKANENIRQMA